jgi:hypothetical protein
MTTNYPRPPPEETPPTYAPTGNEAYFQPVYYPPQKTGRGFAIAALCLGLVGIVFGMIPLTFIMALIGGGLALVFGLLGRRWTIGKWGIATAVGALILGIIGAVIVSNATTKLNNDLNDISTNMDHVTACLNGTTFDADYNIVWPAGCEDVAGP